VISLSLFHSLSLTHSLSKAHPSGGHFPEEGWAGKCGNNEVTCNVPGFGPEGKITFDWKHFTFEDYDGWY
jgi:hypothetical protein